MNWPDLPETGENPDEPDEWYEDSSYGQREHRGDPCGDGTLPGRSW